MASTARAWLMDVGGGFRVAAGGHQVVEYLLSPETLNLPLTPAHCRGVMIWREQMIPVVDLAPLLPGGEAQARGWRRAVVLAYQETPGELLRYGALLVRAAPLEFFAADDMACPLPDDPEVFRYFACSCFAQDDKAIPVLDTTRLFARPLPPIQAVEQEIGENAFRVVDNAFVHRLEPASDMAARDDSVVENVAVWKSFEAGIAPPDAEATTVPAFAASETAMEIASASDSPVATTSVELRNTMETDESADPSHEILLDDAPAVREAAAEVPPADATLVDEPGVTPVAPAHGNVSKARARAISNTVHSYRRLHETERRHSPVGRRRLWPLLAVTVTLVLSVLLWNFFATSNKMPAPDNTGTHARPAGDVAPAGIGPASIPSAPVQPPK